MITTRRQLVKTLLALGAGGVALRYWHLFPHDDKSISITEPDDPDRPSLATFTALSALITLREHPDPETTQRMYDTFMDEPWGPQHISGVYGKLSRQLSDAAKTPLDEGERWFVGHLLTTWYLGIYYHEKRPTQRIAYDKALMFDAVKDVLPVPLMEGNAYGSWSHPPKAAHE